MCMFGFVGFFLIEIVCFVHRICSAVILPVLFSKCFCALQSSNSHQKGSVCLSVFQVVLWFLCGSQGPSPLAQKGKCVGGHNKSLISSNFFMNLKLL